jgi:AraC-like DNA-binding protein
MPLFMDFHKIENVTVEDVKAAHIADELIQGKYGVKYHQFWVNQEAGNVFCLMEGPSKEACENVHREAHGNIACAMTEVESGFYELFMGTGQKKDHGHVQYENGSEDLGYRYTLAIAIFGITKAKNSNDLKKLQHPHWAKTIVLDKFYKCNGRKINWPSDDSLISVFDNAAGALSCATQIQETLLAMSDQQPAILFKVGISADQPVDEAGGFFIDAIKHAHRLSNLANKNQILISSLFKNLCRDVLSASPSVKSFNAAEEDFITHVLEITEENISNNSFSINNLSHDVGVSRPQLYRKIMALTGRSPNSFIRDIRMEKAMTLLKRKAGDNISEIALEVGFNNPSYFAKCFAEKFGCTPSLYIENLPA